MPVRVYVGGSITGVLAVVVVAKVLQLFRSHLHRRSTRNLSLRRKSFSKQPRFVTHLGPAALRLLLETSPVPYVILDLRPEGSGRAAALPAPSKHVFTVSDCDMHLALMDDSSWAARTGSPPGTALPPTQTLIVLVSEPPAAAHESLPAWMSSLEEAGYDRVALLTGPVLDLVHDGVQTHGGDSSPAAVVAVQPQAISRDALAVILGLCMPAQVLSRVHVIDVRRHDEWLLYGGLPGCMHIELLALQSALLLPAPAFLQRYGAEKPQPQDVLVMTSRTCGRALLAARLAADRGYSHILVHRVGVYGWNLDPAVSRYKSYQLGEAPPKPEPFQVEKADEAAGVAELRQLGLQVHVPQDTDGRRNSANHSILYFGL